MKFILMLAFLATTGCSLIASPTQQFKVLGTVNHNRVTVNNHAVVVPTTITVDKNKSITVNAYEDNRLVFTKTVVPVPSTWGKLDTMGVYFLFPGVGLFSPAAMELETDTVFVE